MPREVSTGRVWPVIATVARLLCPDLTLKNEYPRLQQNRLLKGKVSGQIHFTDEERRPLMRMSSARGTALGALWGTDEFLDRAGFGTPLSGLSACGGRGSSYHVGPLGGAFACRWPTALRPDERATWVGARTLGPPHSSRLVRVSHRSGGLRVEGVKV